MDGSVGDSYDALAALYAEMFLDALDEDHDARGQLNDFAQRAAEQSGHVADLGCGPGYVTKFLSDLGVATVGYDLSPGQIEQANKAFPGLEFRIGDQTHLDVPDASLGGIVSRYSLIHLDPAHLDDTFAEWRRVLEPGAPLYVSFFGAVVEHDHGLAFDHKVATAFALFPATVAAHIENAGFSDVTIATLPPPEGGRPFDQATVLGVAPGYSSKSGS